MSEEQVKDTKVIQMPKKAKESVTEYTLDFGDNGVYLITTSSRKLGNQARLAYSKAWFEGIKSGLLSEDKLRKFVKDEDVFDFDVFGAIDEINEELSELQEKLSELKDGEEKDNVANQIVEKQSKLSEYNEVLNVLPQTAEEYADSYRDAVTIQGTVFQKVSDNKKVPLWKTVEDYLESKDTSGLAIILGLHQRLLDSGVEPTEDKIKELFPALWDMVEGLKKEEEDTDE